ncbi:LamG-like jellyroll fold domain-containing protein [Microbispora sp. ZYX-F-249]|uniref:LamG-like jellyroll fold domain-containing protein n=1 Tax=Microbispora maris TaxID=3144104 RepID=A0ABV0B171_9ACTN
MNEESHAADAESEHDPAAPEGRGTGQIWAGSVDGVASGTQASIAVPADTLADGWKIRWRARAVAGATSSAWADWQQVTVDVVQPGEEPLAQTAGPVIRTDQSFTAAAWLRWSDKDGDYTVLEQRGTQQAPFRLGNTPDHGLVFTFTSADAAHATIEGVVSDVEPPVGEWLHLTGVYDAAAHPSSLYLNGTLVEPTPGAFQPGMPTSP